MRRLSVGSSDSSGGSEDNTCEDRRGKDVERIARGERAQRVPLQMRQQARKPMRPTFIGNTSTVISGSVFAADLADK
ncbi:MAG TPA: hypothetical protein VMV87_15690 [Burkholderiales bacterium]|nr:hypothetical protein [Burkholderiales bacterium]